MPKTNITERQAQNPKGSAKVEKGHGKPILELVGGSSTSVSTPHNLLLRLPEGKQRQSFTENSPVIDLGWQQFHQIAHEVSPLFIAHGKEISPSIPLKIDFDQYYALDIQGTLRILTVRAEGRLVGYIFTMFGKSPNHSHELWAQTSMYWLDPLYRQGWTAFRMFRRLIGDCREIGAARLMVISTISFADNRVTKLLQRLGLKPTETVHSRRL